MHPGRLEGNTAAARVYGVLRSLPAHWFGGEELAKAAATTCVSTRISEVRHQLPAGERIEHRSETFQFKRRQYYRLVVVPLAPPLGTYYTPAELERVIDPACGTGGFLATTLFPPGPIRHDRA